MSLVNQLLRMASRSVGVRADEVHGFEQRQVHNALAAMHRKGQLHKAKIEHRHVRFFAHAQMCSSFLEEVKLAAFQRRIDEAAQIPEGNAPWGADAPAHTPDHVKVQVCPAYRPRFQECTFGFVHGVA